MNGERRENRRRGDGKGEGKGNRTGNGEIRANKIVLNLIPLYSAKDARLYDELMHAGGGGPGIANRLNNTHGNINR